MDPTRHDRDHRPSRPIELLRKLLVTPLTETGVRVVDIVILPIGAVVAFFVCIPILILTTIAGVGVGLLLAGLGVPDETAGLMGLVGFVGGLALGFVVLLRLYRRLPARIRSWVTPADETPADASALPIGRDPDADDATFRGRVSSADAGLAAPDASRANRGDD